MQINRDCEECGTTFVAKKRTAKYCSTSCRVRANRRPAKIGLAKSEAVAEAPSIDETRAELQAMLRLLPVDIAQLELRHPHGEDPVMDELIAGLDAHLHGLERVQAWVEAS